MLTQNPFRHQASNIADLLRSQEQIRAIHDFHVSNHENKNTDNCSVIDAEFEIVTTDWRNIPMDACQLTDELLVMLLDMDELLLKNDTNAAVKKIHECISLIRKWKEETVK